jgi:hypothetical protein
VGQSSAMLVWRAASSEECAIGQLDIDATFLNRLDTVGDLDQLAGGDVRLGELAWLDELHGPAFIGL